jgi:hypothetical protein
MAFLEPTACRLSRVTSNCSSLPEQIDESKGGLLCLVGAVEVVAEENHLTKGNCKAG